MLSPETLRRQRGQPFAVVVEVHQNEGDAQVIVVLLQAPEAHLDKAEDSFQDAEGMLPSGSYAGLGAVLSAL